MKNQELEQLLATEMENVHGGAQNQDTCVCERGGRLYGSIEKQFTFFKPKYDLNYNGWRCEGDFMAWNYDVYSGCSAVVHISKKLFRWGDTYVIDILNPADEIMALMLVIAIDAANCSQNKNG